MAVPKFIQNVLGRLKETAAVTTSTADSIPALDGTGRLNINMMPVGVGASTQSLVTSENLASGDFVNIYNNTGTPTARKADATTNGKPAHGFVLAATTSPASATVYLGGINTAVTVAATNAGAYVWLNTTAGGFTLTAPSTAGNLVQILGTVTAANTIRFQPQEIAEVV
jgi:hypothetical protein